LIVFLGCRVILGIGMGAVQATSLSLISILFPKNIMQYIGYLEVGAGLGNAIGPLLGSGLFELGGYSTPFLSFCGVFSLMFIFSIFILPPDKKLDKGSLVASIIFSGQRSLHVSVSHHENDNLLSSPEP
jgi:MFS family permease